MTVDDSEMQQLWKLTNELTAQLVFNRNATLELKQQLADLQAKVANEASILSFPGYRRPSYSYQADIKLRIENERLREDNSQLQEQVREYERWMEYIMGKFRLQNFAMAQGRRESMHEAYKMAEQGGEAAMLLQEENTILQNRLSDLGAVARRAIHEEYYTTESLIDSLEAENQCLREMLGVAEGGITAVTGRLHFHAGSGKAFFADEDDEASVRPLGNRVSFPSTGTGSHLGSSGSDQEQLDDVYDDEGQQQQPLISPRDSGYSFKAPLFPLTVQTGLRTPLSSSPPSRSTSSMSLLSTTSPTSPMWSSSTSISGSALQSPGIYDAADQFKSISPPLVDVEDQNDVKQKSHRGKITINTNLGSPKAGRTM
ncbi:hypothetical protein BGZ99_007873 [Dissophora globulifera]|uniref:Uncharacterized protein n=1 Tax=Dissophora globulifera TaxID=979702 RepID=A0A9P6RAV4_9FUNG|nr:hypothetical protein BGZ99_007873 [Dissophora globulifera]